MNPVLWRKDGFALHWNSGRFPVPFCLGTALTPLGLPSMHWFPRRKAVKFPNSPSSHCPHAATCITHRGLKMVYAKINPLLCDFLWGRGQREGDPQQHRGNAGMTAGIVDILFPLSSLADPERKLPPPAQLCPCPGGTNGFVPS